MKVRLSRSIRQIIEQDALDFEMSQNAFCNAVVCWASERPLESVPMPRGGLSLSFDLYGKNALMYESAQRRGLGMQEWLYAVFYHYAERPKFRREEEIFFEVFNKIQSIIQNKKQCQLAYKNKNFVLEPAFFHNSPGQARCYLVAYDVDAHKYRVLRLVHIRSVLQLHEPIRQLTLDTDYVESIKQNFDPFLSFGQEVKVRFSPQGLVELAKRITNRPKELHSEENIKTFECSIPKAKVYFSGFLSQCEILSPPELRTWVKEEFERGLSLYND